MHFKPVIAGLILILAPLQHINAQDEATPYDKYGISSAIVETKSGKIIDGKDYDLVLPYASLTKLMTALILLDMKIDFNKKITISKYDVGYVDKYISAGDITSQINLRAGDEVTVNDLWHGMLIASSNEAAIALARNSGIGLGLFVKSMNGKAKALGLKNAYFREPTGIDPYNTGTAREMAVIARLAFCNKIINQASSQEEYVIKEIKTGRRIGVYSRNASLLAMDPIGMKVGYLTEAKLNVALRLNWDQKDRVIVVMHSVNSSRRNNEISRLMKK